MYTLYIKPECPFCQKAIKFLDSKQLQYTRINVYDYGGKDKVVQDLYNKNFLKKLQHTVPIVFKNKRYIGGCDDLLQTKI